tara:strand:+ start:1192 stop:1851 length:660 start_codon:yes stop_codon:yes gene_type:complete
MALMFLFLLFFIRSGVVFLHHLSEMIAKWYNPLPKKTYDLTYGDIVCLGFNMVTETVFTKWIWDYEITTISQYFPFNVLLLLVVDDLLYAPFHQFLHASYVYSWIHFRHHKVSHPSKAYLHASMEHPFEMFGALLLHALAIHLLYMYLDKCCILLHISIKGLGACLNHCGKDVMFIGYKTRHHHIHHMYQKYNFAQYIFLYDRMIGSYKCHFAKLNQKA